MGGKSVTVLVDYEREIPMGDKKEKRAFATLHVGKGNKKKSVSETVVAEGLAQVGREIRRFLCWYFDDCNAPDTSSHYSCWLFLRR